MSKKKDGPQTALECRLNEICADKNISKSEFSLSVGKSTSYLSNMNKDITIDVLNNILSMYPEYNIWWIIRGDEPKFIQHVETSEVAKEPVDKLYDYLKSENADLKKRVEELNREIGKLEIQLSGLGYGPAPQDISVNCADADLLKSAQ